MERAVQEDRMVKTEHLLVQLLTLRQATATPCVAGAHTVAMPAVQFQILLAEQILMQLAMV